jgi:predicted porin
VSYQRNDNEATEDAFELRNNASRFGFKGATDLQKNLSVIYQIEYQVAPDDGDEGGDTIAQRNTYVGLKGGFGTVMAGKHDTPLKMAQGKFDQFNDLNGDITTMLEGENRASNIVMYGTPDIGSLKGMVAFIPGEDSTDEDEDGPVDGVSASLAYEAAALYVALAYDTDVLFNTQDTIRLVATYTINALQLGGIYTTSDKDEAPLFGSGEDSEDGIGVSAAYTLGKHVIKAQYITSEQKVEDGSSLSLGVDCIQSKATKLYTFLTIRDGEADLAQESNLGVGIQHNF